MSLRLAMSSAGKEGSETVLVQSDGEGVRATFLNEGLMLLTVTEPGAESVASPGAPALRLSPGEWAVARLATLGLSNHEIAKRRRCSPRTVANHLASAYRKLKVSGRRALRAYLLSHGPQLEPSENGEAP